MLPPIKRFNRVDPKLESALSNAKMLLDSDESYFAKLETAIKDGKSD